MSKMSPPEHQSQATHLMLPERLSPRSLPKPWASTLLRRTVIPSIALLNDPDFNETGPTGRAGANGPGGGAEKEEPLDGHDAPTAMKGAELSPTSMDPKKMKRMLANRESARRSRLRKMQHIEKLRKEIVDEEAKVSLISPQVSFLELQRETLERENNVLKHKIEALANMKAYKEAEFRVLMEEREAMNMMNKTMEKNRELK